MKFRGVDGYANPSEQESLVFLGQLLDELTFDYSLDSYKAPTMNCPTLVREAQSILAADREEDEHTKQARIRPILEELCERLSGNVIVSEMIPGEREVINRLRSESFDVVRSTFDLLLHEMSLRAYINTTMDLLLKACESGGKKNIAFLAKELVTSLENAGMSRSHIHFSTNLFFFDKDKKIERVDDLRSFYRDVFPHLHKFELCFKIDSFAERLSEDNFSGFAMIVANELPEKFANAGCAKNFKRKKEHERFLIVQDIQAFDRFSAVEKGLKRAKLLQNLFRIYHHKNEFGLRGDVVVEQCCVDGMRLASCEKSRMEFVTDDRPAKAANKLNFLLKNTQLMKGRDRTKLLSVAEFHGMSIEASSVENQILNLWISMETLAPSRIGRAKIDNVLEAFLPVTGLGYIRRLVEQATYDLLRWDRSRASKLLRMTGAEGDPAPAKMLRLLALDEHKDARKKAYEELGDFSLLRFRLFSLHESLSRPDLVLGFLDAHQRRVGWQIRRIYRVRNSIVHLGRTPSFAHMIVDNAHDYLDQALKMSNDVSCGPNGMATYETCFHYLAWEFDLFRKRIREADVLSPQILDNLLWKRPSVPSRSDLINRPPSQDDGFGEIETLH